MKQSGFEAALPNEFGFLAQDLNLVTVVVQYCIIWQSYGVTMYLQNPDPDRKQSGSAATLPNEFGFLAQNLNLVT